MYDDFMGWRYVHGDLMGHGGGFRRKSLVHFDHNFLSKLRDVQTHQQLTKPAIKGGLLFVALEYLRSIEKGGSLILRCSNGIKKQE